MATKEAEVAVYPAPVGELKTAHLDPAHRFDDLRHTFGKRMAAANVPMRTLQKWMGHRDIETTQRYADYAPSPHEGCSRRGSVCESIWCKANSAQRRPRQLSIRASGHDSRVV